MKAEQIKRLLPDIYQAVAGTAGPLDGFLAAQEHLHAPSEAAIETFSDKLDPRKAPPKFVYLLAHWMDLGYLLDGPAKSPHFLGGVGRLRELILFAAALGKRRGSAEAIVRILETATGFEGFEIIADPARAYHVTIVAPAGADSFRSVITRIIEAEKPAFTTYELIVAQPRDG